MTTTPRPARALFTRLLLAAALAGATVPVAACKKDASGPAITAENYPESAAGLERLFTDLVAAVQKKDDGRIKAIAESLRLPDPVGWFTATFGEETAVRLAKEYLDNKVDGLSAPGSLKEGVAGLIEAGRTNLTVTRVEHPDDEDATGYQVLAMRGMKRPTPLYTVRFSTGSDKGFTLWSFVWVDGAFRFAGKMKTVDPEPMSKELDMLSELSMKSAREILGRE